MSGGAQGKRLGFDLRGKSGGGLVLYVEGARRVQMRSGFRPRDRDRTTESMEGSWMGFGPLWKGVGLQHTRGLYGPSDNRWSIKQSPNDTKIDRRSTRSKPRPLGKSRSNPKTFNSRTRKEIKGGTGGHRSAEMQNGQRGKCSNACDETRMQMQCT